MVIKGYAKWSGITVPSAVRPFSPSGQGETPSGCWRCSCNPSGCSKVVWELWQVVICATWRCLQALAPPRATSWTPEAQFGVECPAEVELEFFFDSSAHSSCAVLGVREEVSWGPGCRRAFPQASGTSWQLKDRSAWGWGMLNHRRPDNWRHGT